MSDYISRDAALQAMWNALYALEDRQEAESGLDIMRRADVQAGFEAGQQVVAEFPAADVKPVRWIPTEERLPEAGGTYLCVWQGKTVNTGFFCYGHFRLYGEIKDHLITHWMPLPELPSVNGKETEHDPESEG
jgi:hypothetical protein